MKMNTGKNILENEEEVNDLFDSLYDNLDEMIESVKQ